MGTVAQPAALLAMEVDTMDQEVTGWVCSSQFCSVTPEPHERTPSCPGEPGWVQPCRYCGHDTENTDGVCGPCAVAFIQVTLAPIDTRQGEIMTEESQIPPAEAIEYYNELLRARKQPHTPLRTTPPFVLNG